MNPKFFEYKFYQLNLKSSKIIINSPEKLRRKSQNLKEGGTIRRIYSKKLVGAYLLSLEVLIVLKSHRMNSPLRTLAKALTGPQPLKAVIPARNCKSNLTYLRTIV